MRAAIGRGMLGSACCLVLACGGSGPESRTGLVILSGDQVTDTVATLLPAPLVVGLYDDAGNPLGNQVLTFTGDGCPIACGMRVVPYGQPGAPAVTTLDVATDARGEARVLAQFGTTAGGAGVTVTGGPGNRQRHAFFTILPGAPVNFGVAPLDTGVFSGNGYQLRFSISDQFGNVDSAAAAGIGITSLDPSVALVTSAGRVTSRIEGRARFEASLGVLRDTVTLSVLPHFRIATRILPNGTVARMGLDGSGVQLIPLTGDFEALDWIPGGQSLVISRLNPDGRVLVAGGVGAATRLTLTDTLETLECYPEVTADGQTVYFSAQDTGLVNRIYRVRLDGSGLAVTAAAPGSYIPDISPDGDHLAYALLDYNDPCGISVLTISTGQNACLHQEGFVPRWSPDGSKIAFLRNQGGANPFGNDLYQMNPDGTGAARLSNGTTGYLEGGPNWSQDGKWIIVISVQSQLELIRASDGLTLTLSWLPMSGWVVFER